MNNEGVIHTGRSHRCERSEECEEGGEEGCLYYRYERGAQCGNEGRVSSLSFNSLVHRLITLVG
jgi:hypothetical protein